LNSVLILRFLPEMVTKPLGIQGNEFRNVSLAWLTSKEAAHKIDANNFNRACGTDMMYRGASPIRNCHPP